LVHTGNAGGFFALKHTLKKPRNVDVSRLLCDPLMKKIQFRRGHPVLTKPCAAPHPQHFLYFLPLPQGQGAFGGVFVTRIGS